MKNYITFKIIMSVQINISLYGSLANKIIQKKPSEPRLQRLNSINYFTASLRAFPALKPGTLLAAIWISSPV